MTILLDVDIENLKHIGIPEKESRVYVALLRAGDSLVSEIAEKTKVNRSLLYTVLSQLAEKGLVTYIIKNNVRYYRAADPSKILALLQEKEKVFQSILPALAALRAPRTKRPIIEILEGKEGIKTMLNDVLQMKREWFAFNIPGKGPEILGPGVHAFEKERQKEKILLHVLCTTTDEGRTRGREFSQMKYTRVRYLPHLYDSPASNWIYGDRIAIIFWYTEFPFAVRIIDKGLAESYKNHFRILWNSSTA